MHADAVSTPLYCLWLEMEYLTIPSQSPVWKESIIVCLLLSPGEMSELHPYFLIL